MKLETKPSAERIRQARRRATLFGVVSITGLILLSYLLLRSGLGQELSDGSFFMVLLAYILVAVMVGWPWLTRHRIP